MKKIAGLREVMKGAPLNMAQAHRCAGRNSLPSCAYAISPMSAQRLSISRAFAFAL